MKFVRTARNYSKLSMVSFNRQQELQCTIIFCRKNYMPSISTDMLPHTSQTSPYPSNLADLLDVCNVKTGLWTTVSWSDESFYMLFQSDGILEYSEYQTNIFYLSVSFQL